MKLELYLTSLSRPAIRVTSPLPEFTDSTVLELIEYVTFSFSGSTALIKPMRLSEKENYDNYIE